MLFGVVTRAAAESLDHARIVMKKGCLPVFSVKPHQPLLLQRSGFASSKNALVASSVKAAAISATDEPPASSCLQVN